MGMVTVVQINNDHWHELKGHPEELIAKLDILINGHSNQANHNREVQAISPRHSSHKILMYSHMGVLEELNSFTISKLLKEGSYEEAQRLLRFLQEEVTFLKRMYKERLEEINPLLYKAKFLKKKNVSNSKKSSRKQNL